MKKFLCVVLSVFFLFVFTGCQEARAEDTVANFLDAMKIHDMEAALEYCSYTTKNDYLLDDFNRIENVIGSAEMLDAMQMVMAEMEYEILDTHMDGSIAVVNVSITNVDMDLVKMDYLRSAIVADIHYPDATKDEKKILLREAFRDAVEDNLDTTVTNKVAVTLEKVNGKWKIVADEVFINAVYGGWYSTLEE